MIERNGADDRADDGAGRMAGEAGTALDDALARFGAGHRGALEAILPFVRNALPGVPHDVAAAVGWATVDLERAIREAGARPPADAAACADVLLGARAVALDDRLLLLEPTTEGRLAAALARHGEGPIALYLLAGQPAPANLAPTNLAAANLAPGDGVVGGALRLRTGLSALGSGLLVEASRSGPFVLIVSDVQPVPCRA